MKKMKAYFKKTWWAILLLVSVLGSAAYFITDWPAVLSDAWYYGTFFLLVVPVYVMLLFIAVPRLVPQREEWWVISVCGCIITFFLWILYALIGYNTFVEGHNHRIHDEKALAEFKFSCAKAEDIGAASFEKAALDLKNMEDKGEFIVTVKKKGFQDTYIAAKAEADAFIKKRGYYLDGEYHAESTGQQDGSYMWILLSDNTFLVFDIKQSSEWLAADIGEKVVKKWKAEMSSVQMLFAQRGSMHNVPLLDHLSKLHTLVKNGSVYYNDYFIIDGWIYTPLFK